MKVRSPLPHAIALAALATLAASPSLAAWPHDLGSPLPVAPATKDQYLNPNATLPDGAGGAFLAFVNNDGVEGDVYVQHLTAAGTVATGWPAAGVPVCVLPSFRESPKIVADGAGGVILMWMDQRSGTQNDLYAQRVTAAGTIAPGWPANGVAVATQAKDKGQFSICTDGAGGAFAAFELLFTPGTDTDIYAAHVTSAGAATSATINGSLGIQDSPSVAADGTGGFYLVYEDNVGGDYNIDAIRLSASLGAVFPNKTVCVAPGDQLHPQVAVLSGGTAYVIWVDLEFTTYAQVRYNYLSPTGSFGYDFGFSLYPTTTSQAQVVLNPDDTGGLYISWVDARTTGTGTGLYLAHWNSTAGSYPNWPAGGLYLGPGTAEQLWLQAVASDGANGAFVAWNDEVSQSGALMATHVDPFGNLRPLSKPGGNMVVYDGSGGQQLDLVGDGQGGAIMAWPDFHSLVHQLLYAQHLDPYLVLGDARPVSAGVKDVAADQGEHVRVTWNASWFDNAANYGIGSYWIWRQAPLSVAQQAVRMGAVWTDAAGAVTARAGGARRVFRAAPHAAAAYAWEFLASQPANQSPLYSYVAPTTTDSVAGHNPYTVFMIEAHALADSRAFWQSAPDSGYSVDNLAPGTPAPFTGQYTVASTSLQWGPNPESDLAGYRLYRGTSTGFVPGPSNLIATPTGTGYTAPGAPPAVYKLTAIDVHGNESPPAVLVPQGETGVDTSLPRALAFALASGNPSASGASLRLALPRAADVQLAIYDAAGREVRTLVSGPMAAGVWAQAWDGRDAAGARAPSGLYFARVRVEQREFTLRLALTR